MLKEVLIPDIGSFKDVPILEIYVKEGDKVDLETPLLSLESDKATMDVPSPYKGTVKEIKVKLKDKMSKDMKVMIIEVVEEKELSKPVVSASATTNLSNSDSTSVQKEQKVLVPDIGNFKNVPIVDIYVKVGDKIEKETALISLESDKATMDIPSPSAGIVKEIYVKLKDKVSKDSPILLLELSESTSSSKIDTSKKEDVVATKSESQSVVNQQEKSTTIYSPEPVHSTSNPYASPSIRKFARELGVDLRYIKGTGQKSRIQREDVQNFVKNAMKSMPTGESKSSGSGIPSIPSIDFSQFGAIEIKELSRIKKLSGQNLHRSWLNVPHVTQFDEADITELENFRKENTEDVKKKGYKLTLLSFLIKASVYALKTYPEFNSSLSSDLESLVYKKYYHIGVAVDTIDGLVVPVVKNADQKSILDIAKELDVISSKARDKKLSIQDMQGASFTISSLGGIGGTAFTPIVNAPEVAILGVSKSSMKPIYKDGQFIPRLMLPLSLSYDHRVIDGALAARFTSLLSAVLTDIRKILL